MLNSFLCCCCCCCVASVVSNSVRPQRRQPTRLPRPWDSLGKNTGVGCHFLLQFMKVKSESEVAQSCRPHGLQPTRLLCPWDLPGKSTGLGCHRLLQLLPLEVYKFVPTTKILLENNPAAPRWSNSWTSSRFMGRSGGGEEGPIYKLKFHSWDKFNA